MIVLLVFLVGCLSIVPVLFLLGLLSVSWGGS